MALIIDGYNLLNAAGILPRGSGPGNLERSRAALLRFLAESIQPDELARTTVVFDAGESAPRGLAKEVNYQGITVRFASEYENADALIEELIRADSAPRSLTVVSSDHRLQRAARRRRAKAMDSDLWYAEIVRQRRLRPGTRRHAEKPPAPPSADEVTYWMDEFASGESPPPERAVDSPFPPGYAEDLENE